MANTSDDIEGENWRPIAGYEGLYEVSDLGRVRSLDRDVPLKHPYGGAISHRRRSGLLATKPKSNGAVVICLSRDGKAFSVALNGLVLETFVGPRPHGWLAMPKDGDKSNCALSNLEWRPRGKRGAPPTTGTP